MVMHVRWEDGNQIYYDRHRHGIVEVIGPSVHLKMPSLGNFLTGPDAADADGWTTTVVEAGAGTSEFSPAVGDGQFVATIVTAANDNDGLQMQGPGAAITCIADRQAYFGMKFRINDVTQSDLLFGACITDTTVLGGMTDGVYIESLDASASVSSVTEKDSSETQTDSLQTLVDATDTVWEMYWDGTSALFYIDGALVATHTANLPDNEGLLPTIAFLTGEAVAQTLSIHWARWFSWT